MSSFYSRRFALSKVTVRSAFLLVLLLFTFTTATPHALADQLTESDINNLDVSCIAIDPPDSCGANDGAAKRFINFLTGNQPISVAAALGVAVSGPAVAAVAAGAVPTFLSTLLQSLLNVPNFFSNLWLQFLYFIGLRKKRRPWGRVLDSVTDQPIAEAVVALFVDQKGGGKKVMEKNLTDREGRFGFLVPPGRYYFSVSRARYSFPTQILTTPTVYRGEILEVANEKTINLDLYCDPAEVTTPWITTLRKVALAALWLRWPLLAFGTAFAIYGLTKDVIPLNIILVLIYAGLWANEIVTFDKARNTIRLVDENKRPLPFVIFRLYRPGNQQVITTKVTDRHGEAYVLVPSGKYTLQAPTPKHPRGSTTTINLPRGVAARNMTVSIEY